MSEEPGANAVALPFVAPLVRPDNALRYELKVVAADVADTVSGIGGWLFDRAMAGWRVGVVSDGGEDERALRVLGLTAVGLNALWTSVEADSVVRTVIGTSCFESDDHGLAPSCPVADVVFFGSHAPDGLGEQIQRVDYRPSAAALAFKAHAWAMAGGNPGPVGSVETLFRCGRSAGLPDADLASVC